MDILELIKKRCTVRKYKNRPISKEIINLIIEAGRWGPSVITFQPWRFIVITDKKIISEIYQIVLKKVRQLGLVGNVILYMTAETIAAAPVLIIVYRTGAFVEFAEKFGKNCANFAKIAEISATSAAIQNMVLTAENFGIGSCWHDTPLFCRNQINKLLHINDELIAVLTLGYPAEKGKRSPRKPTPETVKCLQ